MNELQVIERQEVQPVQSQMIMPAGTIEDVVKQFHLYQELKTKLSTKDDFQTFKQKVKKPNGGYEWKDKAFPKKSFVRKVQRFFNISCEIIQDEPLRDGSGEIIAWIAKVRAIHLGTGAFQDGDGSCSFDEKADNGKTIHNIRAHAITRAKNRAILDLVGFGDVSAEELPLGYTGDEPEPEPTQPPRGRQSQQQPARNQGQAKPQQQQVKTAQAQPVAQAQQQPAEDRSQYLNGFKQTIDNLADQQPDPEELKKKQEEQKKRGRRKLALLAKEKGLNDEERRAIVKAETGKESSKELTLFELVDMFKLFQKYDSATLKEMAKAHLIAQQQTEALNKEINEILDGTTQKTA